MIILWSFRWRAAWIGLLVLSMVSTDPWAIPDNNKSTSAEKCGATCWACQLSDPSAALSCVYSRLISSLWCSFRTTRADWNFIHLLHVAGLWQVIAIVRLFFKQELHTVQASLSPMSPKHTVLGFWWAGFPIQDLPCHQCIQSHLHDS